MATKLNKKSVDYLAISETKLDDSFPKSLYIRIESVMTTSMETESTEVLCKK